jgi:hypothetical protein
MTDRAILRTILALGFVAAGFNATAAVQYPALNAQTLIGDMGATQGGGNLTLDATVFQIVNNGPPIDIPDVPFSLTTSLVNGDGTTFNYGPGTLSAGELLNATFDTLVITRLPTGSGVFAADLIYGGGSLSGGFPGGRIEGLISNGGAPINFGANFSANTVIGNFGAVVPLPSAVWLFAPTLLGFRLLRRRDAQP